MTPDRPLPPIPAWRARQFAVAALVCPETVNRYLAGQRVHSTTRERIERVLREQAPELVRAAEEVKAP